MSKTQFYNHAPRYEDTWLSITRCYNAYFWYLPIRPDNGGCFLVIKKIVN